MHIQDDMVAIRAYREPIMNERPKKCRMCRSALGTPGHRISICSMMVSVQFLDRRNAICKVIHLDPTNMDLSRKHAPFVNMSNRLYSIVQLTAGVFLLIAMFYLTKMTSAAKNL